MKRDELLKYILSQGCEFMREGGRHSWWHNPVLNKRSAIPIIVFGAEERTKVDFIDSGYKKIRGVSGRYGVTSAT